MRFFSWFIIFNPICTGVLVTAGPTVAEQFVQSTYIVVSY